MSPHDVNELRANESWQRVLAAYVAEQKVRKTVEPEHSGWVSRLQSVEGIEGPELPQIHGRLIAYGLLKFQLAGRTEGVLYQVSTVGREALAALDGRVTATGDEETLEAA